ncbi:RCBTB2, partial [Symbiodinium microadriaticum]
AKCWGSNNNGYLETPSLVGNTRLDGGTDIPAIDLGSGRTAQQVPAGEVTACALLDNGGVKCWGNSNNGQMGYGYSPSKAGHAENTMGDYLPLVNLETDRTAKKLIYASLNGFCAILDSLKCWGRHTGGQDNSNSINDPSTVDSINLGESKTASDIASSQYIICALLDDGTVRCWGSGTSGGLGSGDTVSRGSDSSTPLLSAPLVDLGTGRTAKQVAAGLYFGCALLDNDSVKCWGRNDKGQLGQGDTENRGDEPDELGDKLPPIDLGTGKTAKQLAAMYNGCCALLNDDTVKFWHQAYNHDHREPHRYVDNQPYQYSYMDIDDKPLVQQHQLYGDGHEQLHFQQPNDEQHQEQNRSPAEAARQRQEEQRKEQAAEAAAAVDAAEQESVQELLSILDFDSPANSTETGGVFGQVSMSTETGTLKVAALSPEAVEAAGGSVTVSAGETGAKVEMPAAILFQVEGESAATLQSEPLSINLRGEESQCNMCLLGREQEPMVKQESDRIVQHRGCADICFGVENILQLIMDAISNTPEASVNRCIRLAGAASSVMQSVVHVNQFVTQCVTSAPPDGKFTFTELVLCSLSFSESGAAASAC